jgi:hypothetical protein
VYVGLPLQALQGVQTLAASVPAFTVSALFASGILPATYSSDRSYAHVVNGSTLGYIYELPLASPTLGAATFKADGMLLVPVVVEKAGEVTFAARYTLAAAIKRTLQFTATDNLEAVRTKSVVVDLPLTGTGKVAQSTDFTLNFPKAGTYLIAIASKADGDAPVTVNGLIIRKGTNANLWALPNGNAQSVHYGYPVPKGETALWAYAEAKAAPGPAATYNCVLGFGQGYFGFSAATFSAAANPQMMRT